MSKPSFSGPKRRIARAKTSAPSAPRSLKIKDWSPIDQLAWMEAIRPAVRLQRGGAAAHLAEVSQNDFANRGMGCSIPRGGPPSLWFWITFDGLYLSSKRA